MATSELLFVWYRDNMCNQVYCNVEVRFYWLPMLVLLYPDEVCHGLLTSVVCPAQGMHWIDDDRIAVASDRAKSKQDFVCTVHDQSLALFMLPPGA